MLKKSTIAIVASLVALLQFSVQAQTPRVILSEPSPAGQPEVLACPPGQQNMAGTVSLGTITGQSNDIDLDTMYLCLGDEVEIIHNGDFNLSGDPNGATEPGIGYAFYDCPPTISGDDQATIGTDPCLVPPPPGNLFLVATDGNLNGDILFFNDGNLIDLFNGGAPGLFYFAPITFDALSTTILGADTLYQALYENNGPCVNANIGATIPVVYLNEIAASNLQTNGSCQGSFDLTGGLPEYDGSNYDITITLSGNPSITGSLSSAPYSHGENVVFTVPQNGTYDITVEDEKSCGTSFQMTISTCVALSLTLANETALPGENICVPITIENFTSIVSMQFSIDYDGTLLAFTGVSNVNPLLTSFSPGVFNDTGEAFILSWIDFSFAGITIPDDQVLFELCFDVTGNLGDCSPLDFSTVMGIPIEITDTFGPIGFDGTDGEVCLSSGMVDVMITTDSVSCPGLTDGAITVTASSGTAPYNVSWQALPAGPIQGPGVINADGGSFTANNLPSGQYAVTISDAGPAMDIIDTVEVAEGPTLNVIFNITPPPCNGGQGSLTAIIVLDSVVITNPGLNYTFAWSNLGMTETISGIPSGLYSVTVTDVNTLCTATGTTFLPQTPPINISINNIVSATCTGITDGGATISVNGGTPGAAGNEYTIFWPTINGGTTDVGTTSTVNSLDAGTYTVIVTDGNGCQDSTQVTIGAVKTLGLTTTNFEALDCFGDCDGAIEVMAFTTGGVSNSYTFTWNGVPAIPPPGPTNTATTSAVNDLCTGNYTVTLMDDQGCQLDTTYNLTQPAQLNMTVAELQDESCNVGNDGSITVAVDGGVFPYQYLWSNGLPNDSIQTGLMLGTYFVTVEDANGCLDSLNATVNSPTPPIILSLPDDTLNCSDDTDGSLTVTATAGSAAIVNYNWSNNQNGPGQTTISNLSPGTYFVTVTAADGCEQIDSATVVAPPPLVLDSTQTLLPICPGDGGGSISIFVSGGTGPYFYEWSEPGFSGIGISAIGGAGIEAGVYFVTVTDANNCPELEATVTLEDPPSIEVDFTSILPVSCFQNQGQPCDGIVTASASYSDGTTGVFNFTWASGEMSMGVASSTAMQLCQGNQTVVVSDGTCSTTATVNVPAPPILAVGSDNIDDVSCSGLSDGSITVMGTGGTAPYTYEWETMDVGPTITGLGVGNYTVTITDNNGCFITYVGTIEEPDPVAGFIVGINTVDSVSCFGEEDAIVTVSANGGNIPSNNIINYQWDPSIVPSPGNADQATGLAAGFYTVTVSDSEGCSDVISIAIGSPSPIQFELGEVGTILCPGGTTTVTVDTAFGGNGFNNSWYNFSVDNATGVSLGLPIEVFAGTHTITVSEVTGEGCSADTTIFISAPQDIILEYPEVIEVELGDSVIIEPDVLILAAPIDEDSIMWSPMTYLTFGDNLLEPQVYPLESTQYTIEAYDINGCLVTARVFVEVDKNLNVYIPNIFTPNGDGQNDYFQPYTGTGVERIISFQVFDRWGELIHQARNIPPLEGDDPLVAWDGTFNGNRMNAGVFVYLVEVQMLDGERLLFRGSVTLIR